MSCQNLKWAQKGIDKRNRKYPEVIQEICATVYKPVDSVREHVVYLPGQTQYYPEYVTVDCDSIVKANTLSDIPLTPIKVPCPPSKERVDTFIKNKVVYQSNYAAEKLLTKSKDSVVVLLIKSEQKIKVKNKWILALGSFAALVVIIFLLKTYLKTIYGKVTNAIGITKKIW